MRRDWIARSCILPTHSRSQVSTATGGATSVGLGFQIASTLSTRARLFPAEARSSRPAMVSCADCGAKNETDARFCGTCGARCAPDGSAPPPEPGTDGVHQGASLSRQALCSWLLAGLALVTGVTIWWMSRPNQPNHSASDVSEVSPSAATPSRNDREPSAHEIDAGTQAQSVQGSGWEVLLPPVWRLSTADLTPNGGLASVFTASTAGLISGGERCSHVPANAIESLTASDVIVHVERRGPWPKGLDGVAPFSNVRIPSEAPPAPDAMCVRGSDDLTFQRLSVDIRGTDLTALVVIGSDAESTRHQAERLLRSLVLQSAIP